MATCPRCGSEASGNFCSSCGSALKARPCPSCGALPEPGARFCNQCGGALAGGPVAGAAAAAPAARRGGGASKVRAAEQGVATAETNSKAAWYVAGGFLVALVVVVALPIIKRDPVPAGPGMGAPAAGRAPDISNMSPKERADSLFNRVMRAETAGDTQQVMMFMPMAIAAHEMARPLDPDGLFHLALLHQTAGDHAASLTVAKEMLAANPDYLLGLSTAAESSRELGDMNAARQHYARFLEVYDREMARNLEEYSVHAVTLNATRQNAIQYARP